MEDIVGIAAVVAAALTWMFLRGSFGSRLTDNDEVRTAFRVSDRVPIGAVQPNVLARVVGTVKAEGATLRAPLSGRDCVYYVVLVEEEVTTNGRDRRWQVKYSDCDHVAFALDDHGDVAAVEPLGAETALSHELVQHSGLLHSATREQQALMAKYHDTGSTRRFRETLIAPGETLAVVGSARQMAAPPTGDAFRESSTRMAFASNDVFKLAMSNRPGYVRKR